MTFPKQQKQRGKHTKFRSCIWNKTENCKCLKNILIRFGNFYSMDNFSDIKWLSLSKKHEILIVQ